MIMVKKLRKVDSGARPASVPRIAPRHGLLAIAALFLLGPVNGASAASLAAGSHHSCAVRDNGTVACWGQGLFGQIGNGATVDSSVPVAVSGLVDATQVSAGYGHSCAVRVGGSIVCWGRGLDGVLGNGATVDSSVPVAVSGLVDATQVSAGLSHSCAVRVGGSVACWGQGLFGQFGDGSRANSSVPVAVPGVVDATQVVAGDRKTCAVRANGSVLCWGYYPISGEDPLAPGVTPPVAVDGLADVTQVATGSGRWCAVRRDGSVACWGSSSRPTAVAVPGVGDATHVAVGDQRSCAVRAGGSVVCWDGSSSVEVPGLTDARQVNLGYDRYACALRRTGTVACWGDGIYGQLGNGGTADTATPSEVVGLDLSPTPAPTVVFTGDRVVFSGLVLRPVRAGTCPKTATVVLASGWARSTSTLRLTPVSTGCQLTGTIVSSRWLVRLTSIRVAISGPGLEPLRLTLSARPASPTS